MPKQFQVFVSYNHKDQNTVRKLVKRLKDNKISVWFDEEITPGKLWQDEIGMLMEEIPSVAVVLGSGIGNWQKGEIRKCVDESINRGIPIIPILIKGSQPEVKDPFLKQFMWVDCRDGISKTSLARIIEGITGKKSKKEKKAASVSTKKIGLSVQSGLKKRGSKIPYRVVQESEKYEHYPLSIALNGSSEVLDRITEVEYKLHKAFKRPRRVTSNRVNKFAIEVWAYGGFEMSATIHFDDGKMAKLKHEVILQLPDDDGTNYVKDKSKIGESIFEGCDLPE